MLQLAFKVAADKPSTRKITLVQQVDYPDNVIDFGGPIVAGGENLQMGEGDTLKLELYEDGQPISVLDRLEAIVSIPTAISLRAPRWRSRCLSISLNGAVPSTREPR